MPVRSIMGDVVDRIDFLYHHRGEILGVPTGFKLLDKMLGGLQKSDLVILAARPGVGKTSLAISVAQAAARKYGKRVAVFSLEMSNEQLGAAYAGRRDRHRLAAAAAGRHPRRGRMAPADGSRGRALRCADLHRRHTGHLGAGAAHQGAPPLRRARPGHGGRRLPAAHDRRREAQSKTACRRSATSRAA